MKGWFEIFKAGKHTDSAGRTREWTEEDVKRIAESYNAQEHEAPIVIGHPKENDPAYGWIEKLKFDGGKLLAKAKQIVPEFLEAVEKGLFKKRSVSLYPDGTLRHVGFLGAVPPAVKGLAELKFKEGESTIIEFGEDVVSAEAKEKAALEEKVQELNKTIAELREYKENSEKLTKQLNHAELSKQDAERNLASLNLKMRKLEFQQYLNDKVAVGSLTPAQSEKVSMLLEVLDTVDLKQEGDERIYSFADGKKANPISVLKDFIALLPVQVKQKPVDIPKDFNEDEEDPLVIAQKAVAYQEEQRQKGNEISTVQAVKFVKSNKGAK